MDSIPIEIVAHVSSCLSIKDLKSFRLCCKSFASVGQTNLFSDFDFRLWPSSHRLYQLEQLSSQPDIASRLRCLHFESGIQLEYADYRYWQANVYNDISSERSINQLATNGTHDTEYGDFHKRLQARFTPDMAHRYKLYRWHLDQEAALVAQIGSKWAMAKSIAALKQHNPNLKFEIAMVEPQITLEDLERFDASRYQHEYPEDPDPRRRVTNRREHCLHHFINFLQAPHLSDCKIDDLTAVHIPHELFTHLAATGILEKTFTHLRALDLQIDALPYSDWLSRGGSQIIYSHGRNPAARRIRALLNLPAKLDHL